MFLARILVLVVAVSAIACGGSKTLIVGGSTMGTTWSVKAVKASSAHQAESLELAVQTELDRLEGLMSTWRDDSEVSTFNQANAGCYPVSADTLAVVEQALLITSASGGEFDITVAPLVRLWGFGKNFTGDSIPSSDEIEQQLAKIGSAKLAISNGQLCKATDGLQINLSAIAKGYAVDRVAKILEQLGYKDFLAEVGGELYAAGASPAQRPWTIGVEQPLVDARHIMQSIAVPIRAQGVATSGDYRNYFEKDGKRYSHILSPVTGRPVTHQLASVTVIAKDSMLADVWATALLVAGKDKGLTLAARYNLAVLMIEHGKDGAFTTYQSDSWSMN